MIEFLSSELVILNTFLQKSAEADVLDLML